MRKFSVFVIAIVLASLFVGAPKAARADQGVLCWADSYKLEIGEWTHIYCTGFTPLKYVNVYYVEPAGTAWAYADVKADAQGQVSFGWQNGVKGEFSEVLGTLTFVIQELGPQKQILNQGKVEITDLANGDHVAGAQLVPAQTEFDIATDKVILYGSGFQPGEVVTLWLHTPELCAKAMTAHYVDGKNGDTFSTAPFWQFTGVYQVDNIKADSAGAFVTQRSFWAGNCLGTYRYAARGNSSGLGAYTDIVINGHAIETSAWLTPSQEMVGAFNDTIRFHASGFAANEILNCWITAPDGRTLPFGVDATADPLYPSLGQIRVGADGSGDISMTTGAYVTSRDDPYFSGVTVYPVLSEGALGTWHLTCRGATSGANAVAQYTVYGYESNP